MTMGTVTSSNVRPKRVAMYPVRNNCEMTTSAWTMASRFANTCVRLVSSSNCSSTSCSCSK